jgi:hypothetical protein
MVVARKKRMLLFASLTALAVIIGVLILANIGFDKACSLNWRFLGCLLTSHENLAGGLISGCFTLIAGLIAWVSIHEQIEADKMLASADRDEAERLLKQELSQAADALGALWRLIEEDLTPSLTFERVQSAAEMALKSSATADAISLYRTMAATLAWEKRLNFTRLIDELEEVRRLVDANKPEKTDQLTAYISNMAWLFELCIPETEEHFKGLFRRTAKAYSTEDWVRYAAGLRP